MKKIITILAVLVLVLTGCSQKADGFNPKEWTVERFEKAMKEASENGTSMLHFISKMDDYTYNTYLGYDEADKIDYFKFERNDGVILEAWYNKTDKYFSDGKNVYHSLRTVDEDFMVWETDPDSETNSVTKASYVSSKDGVASFKVYFDEDAYTAYVDEKTNTLINLVMDAYEGTGITMEEIFTLPIKKVPTAFTEVESDKFDELYNNFYNSMVNQLD